MSEEKVEENEKSREKEMHWTDSHTNWSFDKHTEKGR